MIEFCFITWQDLCSCCGCHSLFSCPGDSDSTAVIACCCWGLLYGMKGVPEGNHSNLEYRDRLERSAEQLYALSHWEGHHGLSHWPSVSQAVHWRETRPHTLTHWRSWLVRSVVHWSWVLSLSHKVWCHACLKGKQCPTNPKKSHFCHNMLTQGLVY